MRVNQTRRLFAVAALTAVLLAAGIAASPVAYADGYADGITPGECQPPLTPHLVVGKQGMVVLQGKRLNVRALPAGTILSAIGSGTTFDVIDGPRGVIDNEGDCLAWWFIYVHNLNLYGWIAEGWGEYWVAPLNAFNIYRPGEGGVETIGGVLFQTYLEELDLLEWAVWNAEDGYVLLGWTWTLDDGTLGCSIPETPVLSLEAFCAYARERIE